MLVTVPLSRQNNKNNILQTCVPFNHFFLLHVIDLDQDLKCAEH